MGVFSESFLQNNKPNVSGGQNNQPQTPVSTGAFAKQFGVDEGLQYKAPQPVAPITTPETAQPQEEVGVLKKIQDFVNNLVTTAKPRFKEGMEDAGLLGGIVNVISPYKSKEDRERFQQNMRTYTEMPKGEEILTEIVMNVAANKFEQFAAAGAGISGIIDSRSLTKFDKELLQRNGYLDEQGNIKKGKVAIETGKSVLDLSIFFPQLYVGLEGLGVLATGGKSLTIAGKTVSLGRVVTGTIVGGTYNTLYTPKLENILTDPEVVGDAGKEFLIGAGVGTLISLPVEFIRAPRAPKILTQVEQTELKELYLALAKQYHPDSLINGSDEAFKNVVQHYDAGDIEWLRKLNQATPEQAESILKTVLPNKDKFGGLLTEKAGVVAPVQPEQTASTSTNIVPTEKLGKPTQVYRGTTVAGETLNTTKVNGLTRGESTSTDLAVAERFAEKKGGEIQSFTISPEATVINHSYLEDLVKNVKSPKEQFNIVDKFITDNKIDVVRFDVPEGSLGEAELRVLNPDVVTKSEIIPTTTAKISKSEEAMRDIYKQNKDVVEQALGEVWTEMDIAEAGRRITFEQPDTSERGVIGIKSSFPSWVPEDLRSRKLFDAVMEGLTDIDNIKYPAKNMVARRELFDAILDEVDRRAGVDTSKLRSDILRLYEKPTAKTPVTETKRPVRESPTGSKEPVRKPQEVERERPEHIQRGIEKSKKLTEKEVLAKAKQSLKAYIDRNPTLERFKNDVSNGGQTFGDFEGDLNYNKGNVSIELANGRKFKFTAQEIYGSKPAVVREKVTVSARKTIKESEVKGFNPKNLEDPVSPEATKEADKIIKRSEIAKELSEKLGVPIRQGKFRTPNALGIYKTRAKVVRIKSGGLQTIFHEVGHFLDDKFTFSKNISISERKALMAEYGNAYANQPKRQQEEAFAEFLRFRMTGQTNKVSKMAPSFSKEFESRLEELPEIKDVIDTATRDFKRWNEQPATAKVLSNISTGAQEKDNLLNKINNTLHDIYTAGIDDLHPLSEFSKIAKRTLSGIPADKDPYILARNLRGWVGKAELFLTKGTFAKNYWSVDGNKVKMNFTGKSYSDIMKPIEKAKMLDEFRAYIVSERALELNARGIKTGISPEDAKAVIKELDAKNELFKKVSEERRAYKDSLLEYAKDSGLIGTEGLKKIKELNKFHVPFYRVMEETNSGFMGGKKIAGNVSSPIKKIKGSERDIIDPLESDVKDTYAIINASERNNIAIAMANLASQHYELGRLFEEVSAPMQMTKVTGEEMVKNIYKALNIESSTPERPFTDEEETALAEAVFNVFRPSYAKGVNMLNVNMGDQRKVFQVDPDLFKAIQGLNSEDVGVIMKIVSMPSKLLRAGATLSPDFTVRNPLRDQFTAMVYSNYGFVPGIDLIRGTFELFKKGDVYNLWKASGGEHSMLVSMDRDYLQKNFKDILKNNGEKALDYIKNPVELLRTLSELGEQGTRLGEMKRGLEALVRKKASSPTEVAFSTREVTLDFARIGTKTKAVNLLVAFWNSNVQGTDRMIRAFRDKPFKTLFKVLMGITLPSILLYMANRDDERWDEIPGWQKDLFWIVLTKDHIYRIPKPFELGVIFGSVPERILEFMDKKDPKMLEELKNSVANGATPGFIPTTLLPIIENISNYSFFLDRPIVPQGKEDLPAEAQYGTYTSEVAKLLGKALEYSPSKVDNLIQGYAGGLGKYGVNIIDSVLKGTGIVYEPVEPAKSVEDLPVIKAFMIKPPTGSSSESVNRVYEMYGEAIGQLRYVKKLMEQGSNDDAKAFAKKNRDVVYAPLLQTTISTFSDINKAKEEIRNSTTLSAEKKREKIKKLDDAQLKIAQEVLKQIEADKK